MSGGEQARVGSDWSNAGSVKGRSLPPLSDGPQSSTQERGSL